MISLALLRVGFIGRTDPGVILEIDDTKLLAMADIDEKAAAAMAARFEAKAAVQPRPRRSISE